VSRPKKLTDVEKFYIDGNIDLGVQNLATKLGVPLSSVKNYVEDRVAELQKQQEAEKVEVTPKVENSHMITKTSSGRSGVAIMTEAASMRADDDRRKGPKKVPAHVHTIKQ
jgi:hypothetical protein